MPDSTYFDVTYLTIDAISEGVGSSQIKPLLKRLSDSGLKVQLISYEKYLPTTELRNYFEESGISWHVKQFVNGGPLKGVSRLNELRKSIPPTKLLHARSDIPAVAAIFSRQAPVLWDVRSLWADQKRDIQDSFVNRSLYTSYRSLEKIAAMNSAGMSTLSHAVVPILEERNSGLPKLRIVVSTTVDLHNFKLVQKIPNIVSILFSGTYNDYYDLDLSKRFVNEIQRFSKVNVHWARPLESNRIALNVGETKTYPASQFQMATIIPEYSFGVSVCKLDRGPSLTAAMPTKIGEFLACGRPIVVNKGLGDMDKILDESLVGVALDGTDENLIQSAEKMIDILKDPQTPELCRTVAEKYFNMDIGAQKYLDLYNKILES